MGSHTHQWAPLPPTVLWATGLPVLPLRNCSPPTLEGNSSSESNEALVMILGTWKPTQVTSLSWEGGPRPRESQPLCCPGSLRAWPSPSRHPSGLGWEYQQPEYLKTGSEAALALSVLVAGWEGGIPPLTSGRAPPCRYLAIPPQGHPEASRCHPAIEVSAALASLKLTK